MCGGLSSRPHTHVKVAVSPASTSRAFDMFPTNLPRSSAVSLSSAAQHRPAITTGPAHHPPQKKYNNRTTHTTPPPRQSAPGKTHFHNKYIYRKVPARVCSTGASIRPAVQALPAAYEYPAAQDPTQHAAPERSQAAAQPAHTDAPTNTPQTPAARSVACTHTRTPRQHPPVRLLGRLSAHASLSANRQKKQKQTFLVTKRDLSTACITLSPDQRASTHQRAPATSARVRWRQP